MKHETTKLAARFYKPCMCESSLRSVHPCDNCGGLFRACDVHTERGYGGEWYCTIDCHDEGEALAEERG